LLILGTLLLLGLFLVVRNFTYSALVVSLLFILVFSFGPVWQSVMNWQIANISVGRPSVILILLSIIFLWVLLRAWRSRKSLGGITLYLNVVAFSLLLMNLGPLVDSLMQAKNEEARKIYSEFQNYELGKRGGINDKINQDEKRDIYYIILDAYARNDVLKQYFDYDNGEFTQWLEAKGFFVAPKSTSNYPLTHLSIASSLNMKYLNTLIDSLDKEASDDRMLKDIILENQISKVLKQFGYQTVAVSSGYAYTEMKTADYYIDTLLAIKEIHFLILNMTPLRWLENHLLRRIPFYKPVFDPFAQHRLRTLNMFDSVQSIKTINGPKFVFIHILVPRWPFVFGENGEAVIPKKGFFSFLEGEKEEYQKRYRDQLVFVNKKVKDMVNEILDLPGKKPIIIIQGDHGSDSVLDWQKKPNEEGLRRGTA